MSEKFCLKWNSFSENIANSLCFLREEKNLFDVTLVSDDHKQISAHKLVLSASSEYFREIFRKGIMPQSQLMLCLAGVNFQELNNALEYIYSGEIKIHQEDLERFLEIAERFKLKGLAGAKQEGDKDIKEERPTEQYVNNQHLKMTLNDRFSEIPEKHSMNNLLLPEAEAFPMAKNSVEKINPFDNSLPILNTSVSSINPVIISDTFNSLEELDQKIDGEMLKESDGMWRCGRCPRVSKKKGHIKEHIEVHFDNLSFHCPHPQCGKKFRTRVSFRMHISKQLCAGSQVSPL